MILKENCQSTIQNTAISQKMIGEMVNTGSYEITPCDTCPLATANGCSADNGMGIGPIYEESGVICPSQKGELVVLKDWTVDKARIEPALTKGSNVWGNRS